MGLLSRLRGKPERVPARTLQGRASMAMDCRHPHLAPRWGNAKDMGDYSLATAFECSVCKTVLTREEGDALTAAHSAE